jgi:two-component system CheB/CheR fusion protein
MFVPVDIKRRISRKRSRGALREVSRLGQSLVKNGGDPEVQEQLRATALEVSPVAQVVLDATGRVVGINERARSLFGLHTNDTGRPLRDLQLSYRPVTDMTDYRRLQRELEQSHMEVETAYEELQSTNEELERINDEVRQRGKDLNQANRLLESVLTSLRSGVAVVDRELRVLPWSRHAEELWGLRPDEAGDQHLLNLDFGLRSRSSGPFSKHA